MKRIFSSPVFALAAGLCLRLFFVLKFPADSGDTTLYEEVATNWLKHHVYAIDVHGALTSVDLRMPGYPAFLASIYALTGRTGEAARLWVMLAQAVVDIIGGLFCVWLAGLLLVLSDPRAQQKPVLRAAWWLAMLCPFTANYAAVPLTETFAIALTATALVFLAGLTGSAGDAVFPKPRRPWEWDNGPWHWAASAGLVVGLATLFRPESPLILLMVWIVTAFQLWRRGKIRVWLRIVACSGIACILPLIPWAIRNAIAFHEVQFLTPKYSTLPGEVVPYGFMAWEKTWLYRMRDCYLVPWKLNEESINVDEIPDRAFDSPKEKQRVAAILEQYNEELTLTQQEDDAFGQIARERASRRPLRTYVGIPVARAVVIWFTPRIELLPISGNVFPLAEMHDTDPADQGFTILLFFLNIIYVGLGIWGGAKLWRSAAAVRPAVVFLIFFALLRTAFLTTLETPEPRYVLVCFPALIALGAQLFAGKPAPAPSN
ncbi:MAG TPA: hypothetical protein VJN92_07765 [Candidatus Acidoferrum sp.]|nr:hypothetical protein [Candidatus Acidoferrum sp.]